MGISFLLIFGSLVLSKFGYDEHVNLRESSCNITECINFSSYDLNYTRRVAFVLTVGHKKYLSAVVFSPNNLETRRLCEMNETDTSRVIYCRWDERYPIDTLTIIPPTFALFKDVVIFVMICLLLCGGILIFINLIFQTSDDN